MIEGIHLTSLTAQGDGVVSATWSPVLGGTARFKRDCEITCGYGKIYYVPNTGSVTVTGQPPGNHYYRVCDNFCSKPILLLVK